MKLAQAKQKAFRGLAAEARARNQPERAPVPPTMNTALPLALVGALCLLLGYAAGHVFQSAPDRYYFHVDSRYIVVGDRATGQWRRERLPVIPLERPDAY